MSPTRHMFVGHVYELFHVRCVPIHKCVCEWVHTAHEGVYSRRKTRLPFVTSTLGIYLWVKLGTCCCVLVMLVSLPSATALPVFISVMNRMAAAIRDGSGQRPHLPKCKLLLVSRRGNTIADCCNTLLVLEANVLGIVVGSDAPVDLEVRVLGV